MHALTITSIFALPLAFTLPANTAPILGHPTTTVCYKQDPAAAQLKQVAHRLAPQRSDCWEVADIMQTFTPYGKVTFVSDDVLNPDPLSTTNTTKTPTQSFVSYQSQPIFSPTGNQPGSAEKRDINPTPHQRFTAPYVVRHETCSATIALKPGIEEADADMKIISERTWETWEDCVAKKSGSQLGGWSNVGKDLELSMEYYAGAL